jgi:EAL domain-containing protein (putative c-di-GMP-specific phosphodiesterase class I)/GGDEF domain-containing protein
MSLFKQITIIMSLFLLFVLASVMTLNFHSSAKYAQDELLNNAQNTVSSLSLSLANTKGNVSAMSTMVNALFDSGYFQQITLLDTQQNILYERIQTQDQSPVPLWFTSLYTLETPVASATVSSGWKPVGTVQIIPTQDNADIKLYENFLELLQSFALIALITFTLLFFLLRLILSSLKRLTKQAEAVSSNHFIINTDIPSTKEFKEVTLAMNKMVEKVKDIFEKEASSVQDYHRLLYTDTLTALGNRNYFELKFNEFLASQQADTKGVVLTLFLDGVIEANKTRGHEKVDGLIQELSSLLREKIKGMDQAVLSRIDGTKTSIIFPRMDPQDLEGLAEEILAHAIMKLEQSSIPECGIKLVLQTYGIEDTISGLLSQMQNRLATTQTNTFNTITDDKERTVIERETIENRIKEHSIALALQDVFDLDNGIVHTEAYVRLYDENETLFQASDFIPLVHKMNLDTKLDQNVINYAIKEERLHNREIAINISLHFIQDSDMLKWLKERLASVQDNRVFNFEISNHNLLHCVDEALAFSKMLAQLGHKFGIDRFTVENNTNLNYLQVLMPDYLKIDSSYLHDMLKGKDGQSNNALKILIESLDIKIIASNIEQKQIKEDLETAGIKYFQGSLLAKPALI